MGSSAWDFNFCFYSGKEMTTIKFGRAPWEGLFDDVSGGGGAVSSSASTGLKWFETGVAGDVVGAAGYVISNIIGRPRTPRTVEEFMHGDVASGFYSSSLPLILVGGVALIVVVGLLGKR